jgi:hypothetical protein
MYTEDLRGQVFEHPKEQPNWGGPACVQMAIRSYPSGKCKYQYKKQPDIAKYIQAHSKEPTVWYADPYAITKALNDLCPPPNGKWYDESSIDMKHALWTVLRWMTKYKYPALLCMPKADHWVLVAYYESLDDPTKVNFTDLSWIGYYEPGTSDTSITYVSGGVWSMPLYWGLPCPDGQLWKGKWIAVGEPPEEEGSIKVETVIRTGTSLISARDATILAQKFVVEHGGEPNTIFGSINRPHAGRPMLVRELPLDPEERLDHVRYYVIPFGDRFDIDETGTVAASFSVLVNAYTGVVEEVKVFSQPMRYLSERAAERIATGALRLRRGELAGMELELVKPLWQYVSSAVPVWKVTHAEGFFFITQAGEVSAALYHPKLLGS